MSQVGNFGTFRKSAPTFEWESMRGEREMAALGGSQFKLCSSLWFFEHMKRSRMSLSTSMPEIMCVECNLWPCWQDREKNVRGFLDPLSLYQLPTSEHSVPLTFMLNLNFVRNFNDFKTIHISETVEDINKLRYS